MSHFSVLLIHESDEDTIMSKYNVDATADDGASIEFYSEMSEEQAQQEYDTNIKSGQCTIEDYPTLEDYMEDEYSHLKLKDGEWGYDSNADGLYDWHEVGGRWAGILPSCKNEQELKSLLDNALDLNNEKIKEKYRDKADEYVKISEMPTKQACDYLEIGGTNSILIGDVPAKVIIERFKQIESKWKHHDFKEDSVRSIINTIIIEENYEDTCYHDGDENINEKFFIKKYNYFSKLNKEQGRGFCMTILDLHI